jgi:hypothetical protein
MGRRRGRCCGSGVKGGGERCFSGAVSRILSFRCRRENHLSERPYPRFCACAREAGRLWNLLFGLAPDGACHACAIARAAVGSYSTFSPLPALARGRYCLCGAIRRLRLNGISRIYLRLNRSYAASCPAVFGLSSPGKPGAILRPTEAWALSPHCGGFQSELKTAGEERVEDQG